MALTAWLRQFPGRTAGVGTRPEEHPDHRRPETTIGAQTRATSRGELIPPSAGIAGATHQAVAFATSQYIVQDHLAGRLLTEHRDLTGGAPGAERVAMYGVKHGEFDVT